jgi:hypothetical protein
VKNICHQAQVGNTLLCEGAHNVSLLDVDFGNISICNFIKYYYSSCWKSFGRNGLGIAPNKITYTGFSKAYVTSGQ